MWPSYDDETIEAVSNVLRSGKVNQWTGDNVVKFAEEFAHFADSKFAIALCNGSVALDLALMALGIQKGEEVIVTSRTFLASVSSIVNAGATPVFADCDEDTQNITADTIAAVISDKTRAIICVHLAGWPCDMDPIMALAAQNDLYVIEDCAQAHGAQYKGQSVGSIGHIGCWSFCQDKIMTTGGEGGMVTTNQRDLWSKMWSFKDHGKSWEAVYERSHPPGFRWLHESFGTNWRMTEMQAVIGRIQLGRMKQWQETRIKYANQIWEAARATPLFCAPKLSCEGCVGNCARNRAGCRHAAYKCYIFVEGSEAERDGIMAQINQKGVPCFSGSCSEVYLEKAFDNTGFRPDNRLHIAQKLGATSLMFLCHPTLKQAEIDKTCDVIRQVGV